MKRHGLVEGRRRPHAPWPSQGRGKVQPEVPNEGWTGDFRGATSRHGDRRLGYPWTVADLYSRFLLGVEGLDTVSESQAWPVFERLFREYGLPRAIRTDNGTPFAATRAVGQLSHLSVRFLKLGISLDRIDPGHPEQNGSHERMHRTLKQETASSAGKSCSIPAGTLRPVPQGRLQRTAPSRGLGSADSIGALPPFATGLSGEDARAGVPGALRGAFGAAQWRDQVAGPVALDQ